MTTGESWDKCSLETGITSFARARSASTLIVELPPEKKAKNK
jgi:hypothetical protein